MQILSDSDVAQGRNRRMTMDINLEKISQSLRQKKVVMTQKQETDFGPEDVAHVLDTDMEELGYAEL